MMILNYHHGPAIRHPRYIALVLSGLYWGWLAIIDGYHRYHASAAELDRQVSAALDRGAPVDAINAQASA